MSILLLEAKKQQQTQNEFFYWLRGIRNFYENTK